MGPTLDFKEEIKMRPMELGTGPPVGGLGAKMLAKMGWREGEGLGRTSDGIVEPIEIKMKNDKKGVDFTKADNSRLHLLADPKAAAKCGILSQKEVRMIQEKSEQSSIPGISILPGDRSRSEPKTIYYCNYCSRRLTTEHVLREHCIGRSHLKKAPSNSAPALPSSHVEVKNPVSLLIEHCQRRHWADPRYCDLDRDSKGKAPPGGFKFEVRVNGRIFCPPQGSIDKKKAKVECARFAMQEMGY